ncbi:MAG: hypothetical protein KBT35_05870 [Firmicutes bacterium]|nr:hypothetical protein [Candidatus Colivicinus equi]
MENKKSLLKLNEIQITDDLNIKIPTVGEVLDDEQLYYAIIQSLTSTPFQYMVQLDDMGIDYTDITEYQLFLMLFPTFAQGDMSIIFGDTNLSDCIACHNVSNDTDVIYSPSMDKIIFDELIYIEFTDLLRKINLIEKIKTKPGNEEAKKYLLEKERKKQKRNSKKPYEPYLEKLVISLVNTSEFKYNYEETMNLSIYQFMKSFEQIQRKISFDKTMIGVYAGTVDTSKLSDKSILSWIPVSK